MPPASYTPGARSKKRKSLTLLSRQSLLPENSRRKSTFLSTPARSTKRRQTTAGPSIYPPSAGLFSLTPSSAGGASGALAVPGSSNGLVTRRSMTPSSIQPSRNVDPRPLRERRYQEMIQAEIQSFLLENEYEQTSGMSITENTWKNPTQRDFTTMFKFIYKKFDPTITFDKPVESDFFVLLKILEYPYVDTISRTQVNSVSKSNWPTFLGLLYWMVTEAIGTFEIDINDELSMDDEFDNEFDKITLRLQKNSYVSFLEGGEDNIDQFEFQMISECTELESKMNQELENHDNHEQELRKEYELSYVQLQEIEEAKKKAAALEIDYDKLDEYNHKLEQNRIKSVQILQRINVDVEETNSQIKQTDDEIEKVKQQLQEKNISIDDARKLLITRDNLLEETKLAEVRCAEKQNEVNQRRQVLYKESQNLHRTINSFNNEIEKIDSNDYDLRLSMNEYLSIPSQSFDESQILNKPFDTILVELETCGNTKMTSLQNHQQQNFKLETQLRANNEEYKRISNLLEESKVNFTNKVQEFERRNRLCNEQLELDKSEIRSLEQNITNEIIRVENLREEINQQYSSMVQLQKETKENIPYQLKGMVYQCEQMAKFAVDSINSLGNLTEFVDLFEDTEKLD
ncbi:NDC80 [[Candida] subhashii]|uniref:Kinetochore protein NDC80 n=1 Tax=[Candida] subhashii TaxID=561895 RepID=A0A8J5QJS7_9ASCO|nr:NDC80 [[Candida] subhashii]KAG7663294.1 NDC80 [[Candida] subhashii]